MTTSYLQYVTLYICIMRYEVKRNEIGFNTLKNIYKIRKGYKQIFNNCVQQNIANITQLNTLTRFVYDEFILAQFSQFQIQTIN